MLWHGKVGPFTVTELTADVGTPDHHVPSEGGVAGALDRVEHDGHVSWSADRERVDRHRVRRVGLFRVCDMMGREAKRG